MAMDAGRFSGAVAGFETLRLRERSDPRLNPDCGSLLLSHGQQTPRAVVFLHGITSSPLQFKDLGELFYARGYNVLILRMPRHGFLDRLTEEQASVTAADYRSYAAESVDLGRGLGQHLTVAGLSVGGVVAAWLGQTRADVDLAVLISPSFAPFGLPMALVPGLLQLAERLPNGYVWWDPRQKARLGPTCGYPRFSTRALAESFRLGLDIYRHAKLEAPRSRAILSITNARDLAVNNSATRAVLRRWQAHGSAAVREYTFGTELGPLHDFIGPYQPNARVDYVYPILFDLIDRAGA